MNQIVDEHTRTFIKCVHELCMNIPEQQMKLKVHELFIKNIVF